MAYGAASRAMKQYRQVGVQSGVAGASPHRLVQMLLQGALDRIAKAKGHLERKEIQQKGNQISSAIAIIDALRASLDSENGGKIAENLESLYDYMNRRLLKANIDNDVMKLDEVNQLINDIKGAWDAIPSDLQSIPREQLIARQQSEPRMAMM
jgi:flagellar secretion chaperone FliS